MKRYLTALEVATPGVPSPGLPTISRMLVEAIDEVEAEGGRPGDDPAVLVLGAFVAFHTHADVNTTTGFHRLLDLCHTRLATGVLT